MSDIYLYADETGNLDNDGAGKDGASAYFGFGTAVFDHDHGDEMWDGLRLRASLEERGLTCPRGSTRSTTRTPPAARCLT